MIVIFCCIGVYTLNNNTFDVYMVALFAVVGDVDESILAVPILDTGFVVAKRLKYRRPIYKADRWHFHHRMANIGKKP